MAFAASAALLASCTSSPETKLGLNSETEQTKEHFSEAEVGAAASPRILTAYQSNLPRGGGREMVGNPYQVKGKWYRPAEEPGYKMAGAASWYGDAFHGRLTANGEVYDMYRLSAAHPTMPLPSYARVTNLDNGSSVIVRVNDRGPFAKGRIIDLSKRAAEVLDYKHDGVARVRVEYVGRAPLDGNDDNYLLASYQPGRNIDSTPGYGAGVMVAMNGDTPTRKAGDLAAAAIVDKLGAGSAATASSADDLDLPASVPVAPERPGADLASLESNSAALLGYAGETQSTATRAFAALAPHDGGSTGEYVAAGSFDTRERAEALGARLASYGHTEVRSESGVYSVLLFGDGRMPFDAMLREAWSHGAPEAITVRD